MTVQCYAGVSDSDKYLYFQTFEGLYRTLKVKPPPYKKEHMDANFGHYSHINRKRSFDNEKWGRFVTRLFRIDGGYEWKVAHDDERLYTRDVEGYIAMHISHLKANIRFPLHNFMSNLFKYYFCCPLAQMSPNDITTILWYIVACVKDGNQPTFNGFFTLFFVRLIGAKPFYEVHLNHASVIERRLRDFLPFEFSKGMANCQEEFIMMIWGDLAYLSNFAAQVNPGYHFDKKGISEDVVQLLLKTLRSLGRT